MAVLSPQNLKVCTCIIYSVVCNLSFCFPIIFLRSCYYHSSFSLGILLFLDGPQHIRSKNEGRASTFALDT